MVRRSLIHENQPFRRKSFSGSAALPKLGTEQDVEQKSLISLWSMTAQVS